MVNAVTSERPVSEGALWFGLLGSPIAWLIHLVVMYTLAEATCVTGFPGGRVLGLHGGVFLMLVGTGFTLMLVGVAGAVAYWSGRQIERQEAPADRGVSGQMAYWGLHLTIVFVFIIAVETIPVFFYLQPCS